MNEKTTVINYIFYLQYNEELDNSFYALADVLSKISISLLPISPEDLRVIDKNKKHHVICLRNDLSTAMAFNNVRKSFLDSAMAGGRLQVFDVSSFSEIENASKLDLKSAYRYFQLPQNLKQVAMTVAVDYFKDRNTMAEWPGGRRAKIPSMNKES